jgi:hypothetical protein
MIRHEGEKWVLYSQDGSRKLGEFDTETEAQDREKEIQRVEHAREALDPRSLSGQVAQIRDAFRQHGDRGGFPTISEGGGCPDIIEVYPEVVICHNAGGYWRVTYSFSNNAVAFGEPECVQIEFGPVSEAVELSGMSKPEGHEWEVTIVKPGASVNGYYYEPRVLEAALPLFEGVPVYAFEIEPGRFGHVADALVREKARLPRNLVGRIVEAWQDTTGAIKGRLAILGADWLRQKLMDAWTRGVEGLGLSHDSLLSWMQTTVGGRAIKLVSRFSRVDSVDVVTAPSAGGAFERAVAGSAAPQEETSMKELLEKLRQVRPDLVAALGENPTIDRVVEAIAKATAPAASAVTDEEKKELQGILQRARVAECATVLEARVTEAKLPEPSAKEIRGRFAGRVFEAADLEKAIVSKKEELDALAKSGQVKVGGEGRRIESVIEPIDKLQAALEKSFGLPVPDPARASEGILDAVRATEAVDRARNIAAAYPSAAGFRGLMDAYVAFGGDPERFGEFRKARVSEEITSLSFAVALANTLARRLVMDYRAPRYWEELIITSRKPVKDFRTQEANQVGYFADLADVDPETADYVEIVAPATDLHATYTVGQKGNILSITRKTMVNDDIGIIRALVRRLGRAARRTHARHIWLPITANSAIYDGVALFNAAHGGNLLATVFGIANAQAGITVMRSQTEPDSAERIAFEGRFNLFVPPELEFTAKSATQAGPDSAAKTAADTSLIGMVDAHVHPLFTDATDWVLTASLEDCEMIEVGYLNGMEEPELLLADQPTVGQMFVADKLQYRIRHEYGRAVVDYRGMVKSVNP